MKNTRIHAVALLSLIAAGCTVPATPKYDAAFGESVRQATAMQTINPSAGANADPVTGIDARSGRSAMERYHESFKTPPKTFEVGIGGSGSSQ